MENEENCRDCTLFMIISLAMNKTFEFMVWIYEVTNPRKKKKYFKKLFFRTFLIPIIKSVVFWGKL